MIWFLFGWVIVLTIIVAYVCAAYLYHINVTHKKEL